MLRSLAMVAVLGLGSGAPEQLSKGINAFSMDLYGELARTEHNFVSSPFNLSTSLAMAYVGASGETAHQMAKALHYPTSPFQDVASDFHALVKDFGQAAKGAPFELQLGSSIWLDQTLKLADGYKSTITEDFPGDLHQVDFSKSSSVVADVNKWASSQTKSKMAGLLQQGDIDAATRLLLVSTLYFKAPWRTKFNPVNTADVRFNLDSQHGVKVPMMRQIMTVPYLSEKEFDMVGIRYAADSDGAQFAFVIILPKQVEGLASLEKQFTSQWLSAHLVKMVMTKVSLEIPKFATKTRLNAVAPLKGLGMTQPFSKQADFSGIAGSANLSLNRVIHEAFIDLNEEGTVAGAAAASAIGMTSVPPTKADVIFRATHPFAFMIVDFNSAQILFVGRLINPAVL